MRRRSPRAGHGVEHIEIFFAPGDRTGSAPQMIDLSNAQSLDVSGRGDGRHQVLKVPCGESFIVLKCYGLKRSPLKAFFRELVSRAVAVKSSSTAKARRDTELDVLTLWKQEGFDVPAVYPLSDLPADMPHCIAMEWIPGPTVAAVLQDGKISLTVKKELIARYAREWGARHARALALSEPRLLQEHPTLSHVFFSDDRLVHFDFEIVFTRKNDLQRLIRKEIVGVLRSLAKTGDDVFLPLLETLLQYYPAPSYFQQTARELSRYGTVPPMGWAAVFLRLTRNRKRYRKRNYFIDALNNAIAQR